MQHATGASGAPWSGATSASARVKIIATGSSNQVALLCVRFMDSSNRYCGALTPTGVQIQTAVDGSAGSSARVRRHGATTGTFYDLRISVDASNMLTVFLNGMPRGNVHARRARERHRGGRHVQHDWRRSTTSPSPAPSGPAWQFDDHIDRPVVVC